ncbi:MAG: hypothetical protein Solumvirus2_47 [Solumvirus sp.]|uniref:Uncharacterized protein n=1 Tax=Solumvirus sp. TaxID=2487773 RepID=A0A3G5AGL1_9VIRU|nr:MAG: hypothetical protein Solumvirus2_47 [Solumvirus sp.]
MSLTDLDPLKSSISRTHGPDPLKSHFSGLGTAPQTNNNLWTSSVEGKNSPFYPGKDGFGAPTSKLDHNDVKTSKEIPILDTTVINLNITRQGSGFDDVAEHSPLTYNYDIIYSSGSRVISNKIVKAPYKTGIGYYYLCEVINLLSTHKGKLKIFISDNYTIACLTKYYKDWELNEWKGVKNSDIIKKCIDLKKNRDITFEYKNDLVLNSLGMNYQSSSMGCSGCG